MCRAERGQFLVYFRPRPTRLIGRQRLAIVLMHGVQIPVDRQCRLHNSLAVSVVSTEEDRRFIGPAEGFQTVLDSRDDCLGEPFDVIIVCIHGLTETHQQSHIGIFLDESGYRLPRIVAYQRRDRAVAVLRLYPIVVGEGLADDNIVEHLDDINSPSRCLLGEKGEHFLVFREGGAIDFDSERIVFQSHQRRKRMSVPQIQRVHPVVDEHVEVPYPQLFIVEPREILGCIRILIDPMPGQIGCLLKSHTSPTKHHFGCIADHSGHLQAPRPARSVGNFVTSVNHAAAVVAHDAYPLAIAPDGKSLTFQARCVFSLGQGDVAIGTGPDYCIAQTAELFLQIFSGKELPVRRVPLRRDTHFLRVGSEIGEENNQNKYCFDFLHHFSFISL